jgi:hypothetical protein
MPRVTIPGIKGDVMFPDSMSDAEIMRRAREMQVEATTPLLDPKELPTSKLISGGFSRGIESLKGTVLDLVPALGGAIIGNDKYAKEQLGEYAGRMAAAEEVNPVAYKSFRDIKSAGNLFDYGAETVGEFGPDIIAFLLGAGVGTSAGKTIARKGLESAVKEEAATYAARKGLTKEAEKEFAERMLLRAKDGAVGANVTAKGANIGQKTGLWGSSLGLNVPDTFNQIYQDTGSLEPGIALTIGSLVSALDTYLPSKILNQLGGTGKKVLATEMLNRSTLVPINWKRAFAGQVLKTSAGEGLTEGAQQALQNFASQLAGSKEDFFSQKNIDSIINASLKGAIGGTAFGIPGGAVQAARDKSQRAQDIATQQSLVTAEQERQRQITAQQQVGQETNLAGLSFTTPFQQVETDPNKVPRQVAPGISYTPATGVYTTETQQAAPQMGREVVRQEPAPQGRLEMVGMNAPTVDINQGTLPGIEMPLEQPLQQAEPVTEEVVAPDFKTTLDADTLKTTGLKPQSAFYKQLLNKDLTNPEDQKAVAAVLTQVRMNPRLTDSTKQAIESVAMQAFGALAKQQEMFGPRGGVLKGADQGGRAKREADRGSVSVPSESVAGETAGTANAPEVGGLGTTGDVTGGLDTREELQPDTLTQEEQDALQQELAAEQGTETTPMAQTPVEGIAPAAEGTPQGTIEGGAQVAAPAVAQPVAESAAPTATGQKPTTSKATQTLLKDAEKEKTRREEEEQVTEEEAPSKEFKAPTSYSSFAREDVTNIDDTLAVTDLLGKVALTPIAKAAKTYFGKMPRVIDGLINIAFDLVHNTPRFRREGESTAEANFFKGMDGKTARLAADWVRQNMSPETDKVFRDVIRRFEIARDATNDAQFIQLMIDGITGKGPMVDETIQSYLDAAAAESAGATNRAERRAVSGKTRKILDSAVFRMAQQLHPMVVAAIQAGDLGSALRLLAASEDAFVSRTAERFAGATNAKIEVRTDLRDESGKAVPGFYDPQTNTIYIDANTGMNAHVFLHEVGHSLMSHELDNPNSVLTRQLQQILNDVKDSLDTAYGATDVQEFGAEAWSNPAFKAKLQSINPQGGTITAWDKFSRAVTNFFRRIMGLPSKPLSSAFDEADRILNAIVSPAPESRNSGVLYAPRVEKNKEIFQGMDKAISAIPQLSDSQKAALSEGIKGSGRWAKSALFSLLPMHALGEVADSVFPGLGTRFNTLINERAGYENKLNRGTDAVIDEAKAAVKNRPDQRDAYNKLVNDSTVNEVDPTKPRDAYKDDPEAQKIWDDVNGRYKKLDKAWQNLYVTMRDGYKEMYEQVKKAIDARIDETDLAPETKKQVKYDIMKKLSEKGMIDPYFALGREGSYWLASEYTDKDGQKQFTVEAFKTDYERKLRKAELEKMGATRSDEYSNVSEINYRRAPAGSFVNSVLRIMETNGVADSAIDEMMRLFITTLPETAFAQSFQKRKNTPGYLEDTISVFEKKMRNTAHQVANMMYNPKLTGVVDAMREQTIMVGQGTETSPARDNQLEREYLSEFEKHLKYVMNPSKYDIGSLLASAAFTYTLGFNLSSAIVNMANVPMIVAPYLKGKYIESSVARALGDASKVFLGSGTNAQTPVIGADGRTTMMKVMPSIANYDPDSAEGKKYATLVRIADERGQLNRSQLYEIINGDTRTGFLPKFNAISGWAFHHGERMNREVTMVATYNLELDRLKNDIKNGKITQEQAEVEAANTAIYTTELTNGGIAAAAAPRIAQNPLGKLMFMYKRYGVSMYYMMFKTGRDAIFNSNLSPAEKRAAWRQLGGVFGMSALMAGAQGIPLFGLASMVYALFSDEDDDDLDTVTRKGLGEFLYKGPIEYMTNLSIASRITLNDLIIRDVQGGNNASTFTQQVLQAIGGPAFGVIDRVSRGYSKLGEGHIQRGLEDMLPSFMSNPLKAYRYAAEGTQTLRGDPITGDVSAWNIGAQAFGFAPADYTRQLEINAKGKGLDKYVAQTSSKLKQKYNVARQVGDTDAMMDAREDLLKLGDKHPGLGINPGTIQGILYKSQKQFDKATKEMVNGVRYSKKMLAEIQQDMREFDGQ